MVRQIESGQTLKAAAHTAGVHPRTVRKWCRRFNQEGVTGLQDRSSEPHRLCNPTPQTVVDRIEALRRQPMPGKFIAREVGMSPATVSRVLHHLGLRHLYAFGPAEPARRYEREHPVELIHIDIKKLLRFNRIGHRISGHRRNDDSRGQVTNASMSPSTMHPTLAFRRSPTKRRRAPLPSSKLLSLIIAALASRSPHHDRQWFLLPRQSFRKIMREAQPPAHLYQAVSAPNQRQGRALHPDRAA